MRITRRQLRRLIKEEMTRLTEKSWSGRMKLVIITPEGSPPGVTLADDENPSIAVIVRSIFAAEMLWSGVNRPVNVKNGRADVAKFQDIIDAVESLEWTSEASKALGLRDDETPPGWDSIVEPRPWGKEAADFITTASYTISPPNAGPHDPLRDLQRR